MMHADLGSTNSAFKNRTIPGPEKKIKRVNEFRKKETAAFKMRTFPAAWC